MALSKKLIDGIEKIIEEIRKENDIKNKIIRDDVFSVLQATKDCNVLYYPLQDEAVDGCDGCNVERSINGHKEQFVYINTSNTRERQAFSVAHELGHVWRVDERLKEMYPDEVIDTEEVVNRFAAELLMPTEIFKEQILYKLKDFDHSRKRLKASDVIKLIVYLMNYFFVPFKSVILRFNEVGFLSEDSNDMLLKYKDSDYVKGIINEEQYTRLNIVSNVISKHFQLTNILHFIIIAFTCV
jgi:Zn-dependent peptidase ImmA (M78 family)